MNGQFPVKSASQTKGEGEAGWSSLHAEFYRTLDQSLIQTAVTDLLKNGASEQLEFRASGSRFDCYRLKRRGEVMDLAVNLTRQSLVNATDLQWERWTKSFVANIQHLSKLKLPFIPPMFAQALGSTDLMLVMPYGSQTASEAAPAFGSLAEMQQELLGAMDQKGFSLADLPQIRCWRGVPFVHDFSELTGPF